jgi:transcriptional regulator
MNGTVTIDLFNRLTGQETLHPLVGMADLSGDALNDDICMPCDFYALICKRTEADSSVSLRMVKPGEMFEIPSV